MNAPELSRFRRFGRAKVNSKRELLPFLPDICKAHEEESLPQRTGLGQSRFRP